MARREDVVDVNDNAGLQGGQDFKEFGQNIPLRSDDMRRVDKQDVIRFKRREQSAIYVLKALPQDVDFVIGSSLANAFNLPTVAI